MKNNYFEINFEGKIINKWSFKETELEKYERISYEYALENNNEMVQKSLVIIKELLLEQEWDHIISEIGEKIDNNKWYKIGDKKEKIEQKEFEFIKYCNNNRIRNIDSKDIEGKEKYYFSSDNKIKYKRMM
jgi:hypothetical protein